MAHNSNQDTEPTGAIVYQIRVKGHLGSERSSWFESMTIARKSNGETVMTGPVVDQAALHGLLKKLRDLGLPLISVARLEREQDHWVNGD